MHTTTEVSERRSIHTELDGTTYHITTVTERQDWSNTPANGIYAGKSYRITRSYSSTTAGYRHVMTSSRSEPWTD